MNLHAEFRASFIQLIGMRRRFFRILYLMNLMKDKNSSRNIFHWRPRPWMNTVLMLPATENSPARPSSLHSVQGAVSICSLATP